MSEAAGPPVLKRDAPTSRLFFTTVLNNAILTKHNVRDNERELFAGAVRVATKIFIPFDTKRLEVGGRSFFIEESQFKSHLRELLHLDLHSGDPEVLHDVKVLEVLSHCPTLDAFIIMECLRSEGIRIEPNLFAESYAPITKASTDVLEVFKPLLQRALGKVASSGEMARFVDQVWNVTAATMSNPFLEALQIPRREWPAVIFAWKALIFYDLISRGTGQKLRQVQRVLQGTRPKTRPSSAIATNIEERKRELARNLYRLHDGSTGYIQLALKKVVDAILNETGALALSESLRNMAANITGVGMNVVLFEQVTSYLLYLYPAPSKEPVDAQELESELANLCEIVQLRDKDLCTV